MFTGKPGAFKTFSTLACCHALTLEAQCLSTTVYILTVLSPEEAVYDAHAPRFRQIVEDIGTVLIMMVLCLSRVNTL